MIVFGLILTSLALVRAAQGSAEKSVFAECNLNEASGCEKCAHVAWAQGKTVKDACYNCDCGEVFGRQCGCVHCDNEPQSYCSTTISESTIVPTESILPTSSPTASTSMDGLVRGWPVDGRTFSDKWYKCNNCGWLPSSVGGLVQTMPQNDLGLTWHEACAWWCQQEPECVSAWHRISGNHCSLYNFALPFDANNHPTSHIYVKPTPVMVQFTTSEPGDNCDNACSAIEEECIEDMLFLQSVEEVASWALEVGVSCMQILDRCDIGESPIFRESDGLCTFCSNPDHPGWDNGNRCGAQWHDRQRICPCTSTVVESTIAPEDSTTELVEEYIMVSDASSCESVGMVTITTVSQCAAAVNALGLAENYSQGNVPSTDYYDRKNGCIWHAGAKEATLFSGSIRLDEPCDYRGYAGCLCARSEYELVIDASSCEAAGMKTITEVSQCATAVSALGFAANFDENDVKTSDYYDRKDGCIWHDGAKEVTLFSGSIRMEEPCDYRGYAGCLCEKSETFTTTTMETTEFVNDGCPFFCTDSWVGDNYCDQLGCFMCTHFWNGDVFDGGDCASYPDSSMDSGDDSSMGDGCPAYCIGDWVGDNICDTFECSMCPHFWNDNLFDGGDCGHHESTTAEATTETIHDGCSTNCIDSSVGNNVCDKAECSMCPLFWNGDVFDGGDCNGAIWEHSMTYSEDQCDNSDIDENLVTQYVRMFECNGWGYMYSCSSDGLVQYNQYVDKECTIFGQSMLVPDGECFQYFDEGLFLHVRYNNNPCLDTEISTDVESTTAESTWEPTDGIVRGWPVDGITFSDKWYKCNNCEWLPSSVGGVVQTMPQNDLGLTWHEACAWWCDQEPECVSAWHMISGNHCSLYNFALPFDANDHPTPTSHIYVKPTPAVVQFTTSGPGENCDDACGAIEEECIEDMLILQSAEDVESWALAAGVKCASIIDRCDIGESPIFNYSIWENENLCTFCSNPNHPGWLNGNRCGAKYQVRERICPCTSTSMGTTDSPVESTTAESTTEPTDVVSCRFTIDNIVTMIRYNGEDLETSGNRAVWGTPKVFEFIPVPGAILEIAGEEATPRDEGCEWSGLLLECDNGFVSNPVDFKAFGSNEPIVDYELGEPCVSTSPFSLNGQTSNAQKIWAANGATYAYFQAIPVGLSNVDTYRFTTSEPGQNCDQACGLMEEECVEDMLLLYSAEEVASWASAVGVTCTAIVDRCDIGESPIFNWRNEECTFCSNPNHPGWGNGNRCGAQWHQRERICPCTSTFSTIDPTTAPTQMPTFQPSASPSVSQPTKSPSVSAPTQMPTFQPSASPSISQPTKSPSMSPTPAGYEGSLCAKDDDCDSSRCNFSEFPSRCREKESHSSDCNRDVDCESERCLGRKCVDGRDSDRCNSNDDCQSRRCAFGMPFGKCQTPVEHGENCIRDNDCASKHCLLFACTDHRDGAHCVNDDDCLDGSSCAWSAKGATCMKNHGCTWWNWDECSEKCTWFQKVTFTCY